MSHFALDESAEKGGVEDDGESEDDEEASDEGEHDEPEPEEDVDLLVDGVDGQHAEGVVCLARMTGQVKDQELSESGILFLHQKDVLQSEL